MSKSDSTEAVATELDLGFVNLSHHSSITHYIHLTKNIMPELAISTKLHWPVCNDHCFQRIILDNICGGIWYKKIARPAYLNMSKIQAQQAVMLCDQIINEEIDLNMLNQRSLGWRSVGNS